MDFSLHSTPKRIKNIVASSFAKENSKIRAAIATTAFSLSIDCGDVTFVINWGLHDHWRHSIKNLVGLGEMQACKLSRCIFICLLLQKWQLMEEWEIIVLENLTVILSHSNLYLQICKMQTMEQLQS